MRDGAVLALVGHHVAQPFAKEISGCVQIAGGRGENLRIAGPAEALVALRAIGRHFDEIGTLRPDRIFDQAVHQAWPELKLPAGVETELIGTDTIEMISARPSMVTRA